MTKHMQINIEIDTECDSPNRVKDLIYGLIKEAGDRCFAIESVTIDGVESYKVGVGFINTLAKKQVCDLPNIKRSSEGS